MLEADDPDHPESNLSPQFIRVDAKDLNVQRPQRDKSGERYRLVPNVEEDELLRPIYISALLTQEDVGRAVGKKVSEAIREQVKQFSGDFAKCDHCK
uniref:Uncharacterized protein n=1 Tax=Acrobeloides nanus TaxID=290746 RepID=A0A914DNK2_9BILA